VIRVAAWGRQSSEQRIVAANRLAGETVRVTVREFGDSYVYAGEMIGGASTTGGTTRDVVVIRMRDDSLLAVSGATVHEIRPAPISTPQTRAEGSALT
jgi:hypothetical protein